jgi:hypothetical protein
LKQNFLFVDQRVTEIKALDIPEDLAINVSTTKD